ncbi:uncharacterized protein LAJ45_10907 [Morchella importuna]|uniref:uncharacterized protein n=1 Tax=Morchella importuna TaxID=1174673 RepID=UPI001E8E07A5|nr:uncharacterized protein LAJ45_10907 [Morchella importuna]KAH8145127.1 hypothetical protein LAJ45_10907 [Morchella importuna]
MCGESEGFEGEGEYEEEWYQILPELWWRDEICCRVLELVSCYEQRMKRDVYRETDSVDARVEVRAVEEEEVVVVVFSRMVTSNGTIDTKMK